MSAKSNRAMLEQAEAKIAEAQAAFNKYDADNSGTIDDIEVLQLMADMGLLEKLKTDKVTFLANYFATADTNGDGVLDFEEFKGFYNAAVDDAAGRGGPTKAPSASDKKKAAIAAGALEKKGLPGIEPADQEEVVALSQKLNSKLEPKQQKEWFKIFKKMDEDGSGRITYEEFKDFVRSTGKSKDHGLNLKKKDISDETLTKVWAALDIKNQGALKSDAFGKFMKLGQGDAGPTWKEKLAAEKAAEGAAARADMDEKVGRADNKRFEGITKAEPDAVLNLSKMLNAEMAASTQPHLQDWFKMFAKIDDDGSGRIQFPEIEGMVRKMLGLPKAAISDEQLAAVWLALDDDGSGFITAKEFGPFMKSGMGDPGPTWQERLKADKDAQGAATRADLDEKSGRADNKRLAGIAKAGADAVLSLSKMLNAEMAASTQPHLNDWFKMFTKIDDDGSGRIQFPEFEEMIRKMLELPKDAISDEQVAAVWLALDDDGSGFITAKEFGPFMKSGMGDPGPTWKERRQADKDALARS